MRRSSTYNSTGQQATKSRRPFRPQRLKVGRGSDCFEQKPAGKTRPRNMRIQAEKATSPNHPTASSRQITTREHSRARVDPHVRRPGHQCACRCGRTRPRPALRPCRPLHRIAQAAALPPGHVIRMCGPSVVEAALPRHYHYRSLARPVLPRRRGRRSGRRTRKKAGSISIPGRGRFPGKLVLGEQGHMAVRPSPDVRTSPRTTSLALPLHTRHASAAFTGRCRSSSVSVAAVVPFLVRHGAPLFSGVTETAVPRARGRRVPLSERTGAARAVSRPRLCADHARRRTTTNLKNGREELSARARNGRDHRHPRAGRSVSGTAHAGYGGVTGSGRRPKVSVLCTVVPAFGQVRRVWFRGTPSVPCSQTHFFSSAGSVSCM
jgi:hypothetical protein